MCVCVLAAFSSRTTEERVCDVRVMEKYRMTMDEGESSSIRRVSAAQSNKQQKDGGSDQEKKRMTTRAAKKKGGKESEQPLEEAFGKLILINN